MNDTYRICCLALVLIATGLFAAVARAQDQGQAQADPIPLSAITALEAKLDEAGQSASSARTKLSLKRVIREGEGLIKASPQAPNRFAVLGVLFRGQQQLVRLDDSRANRAALLATAERLAAAPDDYAAARLDADLLVSQAELARRGADPRARAEALRPLVARYRGTEVEAKVVRIAMLMALEFGDSRLLAHLRQVIAERLAGDPEMINFQRDKLAGQVFAAPFVGRFERSDGKAVVLPMDALGKTTGLYFWSKEGDGLEQLKLLAEGWNKVKADPEKQAEDRYQFISINLDGLPDAGESLLREVGLDWPALHLPGGAASEVYKTYARNTPKLLTMTPTGQTAMVMSGSTRVRPDRGWERSFQSRLARSWSHATYNRQMQSLLSGEFLVMDPAGGLDPAAPPELQALTPDGSEPTPLDRGPNAIPDDTLQAIQACFTRPPMRYSLPQDQAIANYKKAEQLCHRAIASHPDSADLWLVRNRRIIALMGLWKLEGKREHFDAAAREAKQAIDAGYPPGADVVARYCLAHQALRGEDAKPAEVIKAFAEGEGATAVTRPALAALLALGVADRPLHEHYRRVSLDRHADHPALWTATAFFLDRYHRYWLYHPPFTAGWTYGRRQGYFLAIGEPEDAQRTLPLELKTLDGETVSIPDTANGKWTIISFVPTAAGNGHLQRYGRFIEERPGDDVKLIEAVLDDDAQAARHALSEKKKPDDIPLLLVPGGMDNPLVQKLGILEPDSRANLVILRPDGSIAAALSGLTMSAQHGNAMQQVIQWHDEKAVDEALARGDLEAAKRQAFTYAPPEDAEPADEKNKRKPAAISPPHLRSRAKVYAAMGQWQKAYDDAHAAYLQVNSKAGWLSMRTAELARTEALKAEIAAELEQTASGQ